MAKAKRHFEGKGKITLKSKALRWQRQVDKSQRQGQFEGKCHDGKCPSKAKALRWQRQRQGHFDVKV
jgi:hypothetical protein